MTYSYKEPSPYSKAMPQIDRSNTVFGSKPLKKLMLPEGNKLGWNSAAPVLFKVNPARWEGKDNVIICNFELQRCYLHTVMKAG